MAKRVEKRLAQEQGVSSVTTWVGSGVPRFYLPMDQVFPQSNVSQLIVLPKDLQVREALRIKLPALLAQEFPEVRGRVKLLPNGPPVPYPVQFRVVGTEPSVLRQKAEEVKAAMRLNNNTRGVNELVIEASAPVNGQILVAELPRVVSWNMVTDAIDFANANGWTPNETAEPYRCTYSRREFHRAD